MTKAEMIAKVAEKMGTTKTNAGEAVNAVIDVIADAVVDGDKVQLAGFGTFEVRGRAARVGYNPATGESIDIPASKSVGFKVSKTLKDAVNGR